MSNDIFDFGFTAVDEDELKSSRDAARRVEEYSTTINDTQDRLDKLYNAVVPLLNNLKANPEKEYILWPNRVEKVEQFETLLYDIYKK